MSDLISRQAAIDAIEEYADRLQMVNWKENPGVPYKAYALNWCINTIRDLPSAQPERKTGRWIGTDEWCCLCSECNQKVSIQLAELINFCPNCGAEMVKDCHQLEEDES